LKGGDSLKDPGIDQRMNLKEIGCENVAGFVWFSIGSSNCEHGNELFKFHKR
jgi:hypothetical protein